MIDDSWETFKNTVNPIKKGNAKTLLHSNKHAIKHRKSKSPMLDEKENRINLLLLSESSISNDENIFRNMSRLDDDELCLIKNYAKKIHKEIFDNRIIIKHLLAIICRVQKLRKSDKRITASEKAFLKMESQLRIKEITDAHPLGHIIAACQVTEYKASGSKKSWGTPRKKRG